MMPEKKLQVKNETYNRLKPVVGIWLPAIATFYATLAAIWGWPRAEETLATIVGLNTLLGVLLGISTKNYKEAMATDLENNANGVLRVNHGDPMVDDYKFEMHQDLNKVETLDEIRLKVVRDSQTKHGL